MIAWVVKVLLIFKVRKLYATIYDTYKLLYRKKIPKDERIQYVMK